MIMTSPGLIREGGVLHFAAALFPDPDVYRPIGTQWMATVGLVAMAVPAMIISWLTRPDPRGQELTWWAVRHRPDAPVVSALEAGTPEPTGEHAA